MAETVKELNIGDRLLLGRYSADPLNIDPPRITWLKASPNCDFITEFAIDRLIYDKREVGDNRDYLRSNIHQFLNSEERSWYSPTHPRDIPPLQTNPWYLGYGMYGDHPGFLTFFDDFEVDSLVNTCMGKICLPEVTNFTQSASQFKLFSRKGIRAKFTSDCWNAHWREMEIERFVGSSYIETMTRSPYSYDSRICIIDRSGALYNCSTDTPLGVRPICVVNPDTKISIVFPGVYEVTPYGASSSLFDRTALEELFGLV